MFIEVDRSKDWKRSKQEKTIKRLGYEKRGLLTNRELSQYDFIILSKKRGLLFCSRHYEPVLFITDLETIWTKEISDLDRSAIESHIEKVILELELEEN